MSTRWSAWDCWRSAWWNFCGEASPRGGASLHPADCADCAAHGTLLSGPTLRIISRPWALGKVDISASFIYLVAYPDVATTLTYPALPSVGHSAYLRQTWLY